MLFGRHRGPNFELSAAAAPLDFPIMLPAGIRAAPDQRAVPGHQGASLRRLLQVSHRDPHTLEKSV